MHVTRACVKSSCCHTVCTTVWLDARKEDRGRAGSRRKAELRGRDKSVGLGSWAGSRRRERAAEAGRRLGRVDKTLYWAQTTKLATETGQRLRSWRLRRGRGYKGRPDRGQAAGAGGWDKAYAGAYKTRQRLGRATETGKRLQRG
eukprot:353336-Chlamydomonas_euryale.AAC.12